MIEVRGNLWTFPADVRIITTNGFVKNDGRCVMGRGCAKEAATRFPELPLALGQAIKAYGNKPFYFPMSGMNLITMPVKHHWYQEADLNLISESAQTIAGMKVLRGVSCVVMPRPGCGNGRLKWEDVSRVLAPILDDRFHVITF